MKHYNEHLALQSYNKTVQQVFASILKHAKQLLSTVKEDGLRLCYERNCKEVRPNTILYEMVNPLLYLRLECDIQGRCTIHFGIESIKENDPLQDLTSLYLRYIFYSTAKYNTTENIEDCVKTDWFITVCTEMFEYVDIQQKYHILKSIPYKPTIIKRGKSMLHVQEVQAAP